MGSQGRPGRRNSTFPHTRFETPLNQGGQAESLNSSLNIELNSAQQQHCCLLTPAQDANHNHGASCHAGRQLLRFHGDDGAVPAGVGVDGQDSVEQPEQEALLASPASWLTPSCLAKRRRKGRGRESWRGACKRGSQTDLRQL